MIIIDIICEAIGYGIATLMFLAIPIIIIAVPIIIIFCCIGVNDVTKRDRQSKAAARAEAKAAKRAEEDKKQLQREEEQIRGQIVFETKLEVVAKYDRESFNLITKYMHKGEEHAETAMRKLLNRDTKGFEQHKRLAKCYEQKVNELLDEAYNKIHKEV